MGSIKSTYSEARYMSLRVQVSRVSITFNDENPLKTTGTPIELIAKVLKKMASCVMLH